MFTKFPKKILLCFLLIISIMFSSSTIFASNQEINSFELDSEAKLIFAENEISFDIDLNEIFENNFELEEDSLSSEFEPEVSFSSETILQITDSSKISTDDSFAEESQPNLAAADVTTIVINQEYRRVSSTEFEFRFNIDAPFTLFKPNISKATATVAVAVADNGAYSTILTESFYNPSYLGWHSVKVNAQTKHFRYTVTLQPESGVLSVNTAQIQLLVNKSGVVWKYNYTCPLTGLKITPPNTNWTKISTPHPASYTYRDPYISWVKTNFDPNFNWDNKPIHHIRPWSLGGANALGNLIHLTTTQHQPISDWFAGY